MSDLKQRLRIVWENNPPMRYLPQSLDGGTGWGVWDEKLNRFLTDDEVRAIPLEDFRTSIHLN